jgi:hypothetical protein
VYCQWGEVLGYIYLFFEQHSHNIWLCPLAIERSIMGIIHCCWRIMAPYTFVMTPDPTFDGILLGVSFFLGRDKASCHWLNILLLYYFCNWPFRSINYSVLSKIVRFSGKKFLCYPKQTFCTTQATCVTFIIAPKELSSILHLFMCNEFIGSQRNIQEYLLLACGYQLLMYSIYHVDFDDTI